MNHQFLLILMSGTMLINPALGKTTLKKTLESAYTTPQIQAKREETLSKHEAHVQAKAGFLPKVTIGVSHARNNGTMSQNRNSEINREKSTSLTSQGYITLRQNIFKGWSTLASMDKVNADVFRAWAELELEEQKIMKEAIDTYLDLIAAQKNIEVTRQNVDFLKQAYFAADKKYQVGEETITNVSAAQAELLSGEAEWVSAQAEYENARATFTYKTGLTPDHDLDSLTLPDFFPKNLDIAKSLSDNHNQNIIAAHYAIESSSSDVEAITGNLLPSIDLSIDAARTHERKNQHPPHVGDSMSVTTTHQTPITIKAEISMPLYDAGEIRSKRRQTLKMLSAQKVNYQKIKNEVSQAITTIWNRHDALKNTFNAYQEVVKASGQAVNSLLEEQKAGSKTLLDVLKQQKEHFQRQRKLVDTEKDYLKNAYNFLSIIGILTPQRLKLDVNVIDLKTNYDNTKMWF